VAETAVVETEPEAAPATDAPLTRAVWFRVLVVGFVLAGIVLRVVLLRKATGVLDSDEAVVGLMARHILHNHDFTTFYWGQNYGGSLTAIVMAAVFAVFGESTTTLKIVPLAMSAVSAVLVWRLGRRTVGEPAATFAALAFWVFPTNYVWLSTKERGFYWATDILGLTFLLLVSHLVEKPRAWALWVALGFVGGVGWWTSPQIVYFAAPGLAWLAYKLRRDALRIWIAIPAALLGALPWLIWNVDNNFAALVPTSHQFDKGYVGNIGELVRHGVPVMLGFNVIERWLVPVVFPLLYVAVVVFGIVGIVLRKPRPWLLILVVLAFPLLWGAFPVSGVIGEGRYVMFLLPAFVLLLMYAARSPILQVILLLGALGVSADGIHRITCCTSPRAPDVAMPLHTGPLISALEQKHVHAFYGDYWIAFRVAFETDEKIVGSPRIFRRWPPYDRAAADQNPTTAVFVAKSELATAFERGLERLGIPYTKTPAGDFVIYQTARRTSVEPVLAAGAKRT
jgi:hypothetical protein